MYNHKNAPIAIEFFGHSGTCVKCEDGIVKMKRRRDTFELDPNDCQCLGCGQSYFVEVKDIEEFEDRQWEQKHWRATGQKPRVVR